MAKLPAAPPPGTCPDGATGAPCESARRRAQEEAFRRRICPEAFDENGRIKPGGMALVIQAAKKLGLGPCGRPPIAPPRGLLPDA